MSVQALTNPTYAPAMRVVTAVTNSNPAVITTSFANGYVSGTIVRMVIPLGFGIELLNDQVFPITVTSATTFTIPLDTTAFGYGVFSVPANNEQYAQVVPIGEISSILTAAVQNVLAPPNAQGI